MIEENNNEASVIETHLLQNKTLKKANKIKNNTVAKATL